MLDRLQFLINRISERLWVRPLVVVVLSVIGAFLARLADYTQMGEWVPEVSRDSVETLLTIISSSMLVIATFAVASMVSAYASASNTATPRSFSLVVADDVSQNALSTFIGAFIFSIVSLIALLNEYYGQGGLFTLFVLTLLTFAIVIFTFVRWVDRIARLGRMGAIIDKVENAAGKALERRKRAPTLRGLRARGEPGPDAVAVYSPDVGYVNHIGMTALQQFAEDAAARVTVAALPGTFVSAGQPLAFLEPDEGTLDGLDTTPLVKAFVVRDERVYDEDPRFGVIVLSEIASRALSPAVNDPGTAIDIIGTLVRLLTAWVKPDESTEPPTVEFDRVAVPGLRTEDLFDDAFSAIARDGAALIEVIVRLQKAFAALAALGDARVRELAVRHARQTLVRVEKQMSLDDEVALVRILTRQVGSEDD